ncbi:MAG: hypothetical protein ABI679_11755 [Gemmatimonadota bacterium]
MNDDQIFATVLIVLLALVVPVGLMFLIPLAKAFRRTVEVRMIPSNTPGEIEELRSRVQELEERLDFTERVLSQVRDPDRIDSGEQSLR